MTIFTRRGGSIVFFGFMCISLSIALAGYQAIQILTNTFLGDVFSSFIGEGGLDFSSLYPPNDQLNSAALGIIIWASLTELFVQLLFNTYFTITPSLILYFMILGTMLIFSVVSGYPAFAAGAGPGSVRLKRVLGKQKAFAGDYLLVEVKLRNRSINPIPVIEIYDAYPEVFELVLGENFLTTQLGPKQSLSYAYILRLPVRGRFLIGPTKIIIHDKQGFFSDEAVLAELSDLLVYPSYEDIKKLQMLGSKRQLGKLFGSHRTKIKGMGTDFFGIREFQPGDPLKYVHWAAVAKSGGERLMVREFESEQNIRVLLLLDASASMGSGIPRNTKLEYAIRSCVMMAHLAMENKDTVGLAVINERFDHNKFLEPTGSKTFQFKFLELLANVKAEKKIKWIDTCESVVTNLGKASYVIIVSDLEGSHTEFLEGIKKLRASKHRIFVISPFGPWFETKSWDLTPTDRIIGEAIEEGFVEKRKQLFKKITKFEGSAISVGPNDMLANVMSEFQKLKAMSGA
ncbi:MAG: DUF58 domain-containing protein [Candidatus Heimdallarchaeota archaeon]|nr:DUF58 domain-containing protein [Candidatus Heimdallarchaeota archaeon]MDH5645369.1 DUF58 domain-containing protein [Candidatus Heimdallarchaeota archaeon]